MKRNKLKLPAMRCPLSIVHYQLYFALFLLFFPYPLFLHAQQHKIDSLEVLLKADKEDTLKVKHLNTLCAYYRVSGDMNKALDYATHSATLAQSLHYMKGLGLAYNGIGCVYFVQSDLKHALIYFQRSDSVYELIHDKAGQSSEVANIGLIYYNQGDYPRSLNNQLKAMQLDREIGDTGDFASSYGNIGNIYRAEGNIAKALQYQQMALRLDTKNNDKGGQAEDLVNIGIIYNDRKRTDSALIYYNRALELYRQVDDKGGIAGILANIGVLYFSADSLDKAMKNYMEALKVDEETNNKDYEARLYSNIGEIYLKQKNYPASEKYYLLSLKLSDSLKRNEDVKFSADGLSKLYAQIGQWDKAYKYYKQFCDIKDSLINDDKSKEIGKLEAKADYDKQLALQQADAEKQAALASADSKKKQITILFVGAIALAVAIIAVIILRSLRVTRKQKALIENQKAIVEEQKVIVEQQKAIVEEKNKDITDSIHYASRIQHALLTSEDYISKYLKDYFILFKPRDIVSGDFYWAVAPPPPEGGTSTKNGNPPSEGREASFLICAGDCTGHGVPGAFMSLLNISLLNEATLEKKIYSPDKILNEVRQHIIKALNPDGSDKGKDGMDCILASFDLEKRMLHFACANNPLWIISDPLGARKITEFTPDKMPVGMQTGDEKPFTLHSVELKRGDCVYIFTDGFADQFGGPKGKKFKYKQLQELLQANAHKQMKSQKEALNNAFEAWKGDLEQIDDVLVIGIRV